MPSGDWHEVPMAMALRLNEVFDYKRIIKVQVKLLVQTVIH